MRTPDYPSADSERWAAVDAYFAGLLAPSAATLDEALSANEAAGIPAHDVSALQGKMLALFARVVGARPAKAQCRRADQGNRQDVQREPFDHIQAIKGAERWRDYGLNSGS